MLIWTSTINITGQEYSRRYKRCFRHRYEIEETHDVHPSQVGSYTVNGRHECGYVPQRSTFTAGASLELLIHSCSCVRFGKLADE